MSNDTTSSHQKAIKELKKELKDWEQQFSDKNGRKPTKQDIVQDKEIARRYKAYAKIKTMSEAPNLPEPNVVSSHKIIKEKSQEASASSPRVKVESSDEIVAQAAEDDESSVSTSNKKGANSEERKSRPSSSKDPRASSPVKKRSSATRRSNKVNEKQGDSSESQLPRKETRPKSASRRHAKTSESLKEKNEFDSETQEEGKPTWGTGYMPENFRVRKSVIPNGPIASEGPLADAAKNINVVDSSDEIDNFFSSSKEPAGKSDNISASPMTAAALRPDDYTNYYQSSPPANEFNNFMNRKKEVEDYTCSRKSGSSPNPMGVTSSPFTTSPANWSDSPSIIKNIEVKPATEGQNQPKKNGFVVVNSARKSNMSISTSGMSDDEHIITPPSQPMQAEKIGASIKIVEPKPSAMPPPSQLLPNKTAAFGMTSSLNSPIQTPNRSLNSSPALNVSSMPALNSSAATINSSRRNPPAGINSSAQSITNKERAMYKEDDELAEEVLENSKNIVAPLIKTVDKKGLGLQVRATPVLSPKVFERIPVDAILRCRVFRKKNLVDKLHPTFFIYNEADDKFLMASRKKRKSKTVNYTISNSQQDFSKGSNHYLAKLKANSQKTTFILSDARSYDEHQENAGLKEISAISYSKTVLPREMSIAIPNMEVTDPSFVFTKDIMSEVKNQNSEKIVTLRNKPPRWNEATQSHCLNFGGRVTLPSIKNFQLVAETDESTIVMQFGRCGPDFFTLDARWPLTPIEAFAIALTSFDAYDSA